MHRRAGPLVQLPLRAESQAARLLGGATVAQVISGPVGEPALSSGTSPCIARLRQTPTTW